MPGKNKISYFRGIQNTQFEIMQYSYSGRENYLLINVRLGTVEAPVYGQIFIKLHLL